MTRAGDNGEILKLRQVTWKTNLSRQISEFSELIQDDEIFQKYFGESYVERLTEKSNALTRAIVKLVIADSILMLSLFASQHFGEADFEVFGYGFKNLAHYKELLLLLAAVISPISAVLAAYKKYIVEIIRESLKKLAPAEDARKFYAYKFLDAYFDGLIPKTTGTSTTWHGFTVFMTVVFVMAMLSLILTLVAASFFIQINVIYDVATKPSLSPDINLFVVIFAISSILFSWLITLMQLPMPEVDLSNYSKLLKMEEQDPAKYQETMERLAKDSTKKDVLSTILVSAIINIAVFTGVAIYWFPSSLLNLSYFLVKALPGTFFVVLISSELVSQVKSRSMRWFFRKYPDESDQRLRVYARMGKLLSLAKVAVPFCLSVAYTIYTLSN